MQTIHIDVDESKMDVFYHERKVRLKKLKKDIDLGKEKLYNFKISINHLMEELKID